MAGKKETQKTWGERQADALAGKAPKETKEEKEDDEKDEDKE
jgi:hypothetical protein